MASFTREKKRILFVENDEDAWELVTLQLPGYKVVSARDFTEGLRLAKQGYFDFYILDNWLPDGTGVELCRRIREFDPHTPIVFFSAPHISPQSRCFSRRFFDSSCRSLSKSAGVRPIGLSFARKLIVGGKIRQFAAKSSRGWQLITNDN